MGRHRKSEPFITDIDNHPRTEVGLAVAADWLGLDERTVRNRIESGKLRATRDGRVYRIKVADLLAYVTQHRMAS